MFAARFVATAITRAAVFLAFSCLASAHVGSPDVFFEGNAGPYRVLIAIRPPDVIPGVAHVEVRALSEGVNKVEVFPTPVRGEGAKHPPVADIATQSAADPRYYEASVWLMSFGSWEVHVRASGAKGSGELPVPVPALAFKTKPMPLFTGYFLGGMMLFLTVGMIAIVGASVREAQTAPGTPAAQWSRTSMIAMAVAAGVVILMIWIGASWWADDAANNRRKIYVPLRAIATLDAPSHLTVQVVDPGWTTLRKLDDLVPDHGHLMHLFLVRWPAMDEVFHLHPDQLSTGFFGQNMPSLPAGDYKMYCDIVHESGIAETAVGDVTLPQVNGQPLRGDDAGGAMPGLDSTLLNATDLGGGYRMIRVDDNRQLVAKQVALFTFAIAGPDGKPVDDLEPYMGMGGHAEFLKTDASVFAHVHPTGSVPMASVAVASPEAMMAMHERKVGPLVSFPYGVPTPGRYRIFVQLKRAGKVVTGAFDIVAR